MNNDKPFHDWLVKYLKHKLSRDYQDVRMNLSDEKKTEFKGRYPDLILGNHGMVLAVVEVETEKSITDGKADEWKDLTGHGVKLIIMVPGASKAKVIELLWGKGIADKVAVGSYELNIKMP